MSESNQINLSVIRKRQLDATEAVLQLSSEDSNKSVRRAAAAVSSLSMLVSAMVDRMVALVSDLEQSESMLRDVIVGRDDDAEAVRIQAEAVRSLMAADGTTDEQFAALSSIATGLDLICKSVADDDPSIEDVDDDPSTVGVGSKPSEA